MTAKNPNPNRLVFTPINVPQFQPLAALWRLTDDGSGFMRKITPIRQNTDFKAHIAQFHFCQFGRKVAQIVHCGLRQLYAVLVGAYAPMRATRSD